MTNRERKVEDRNTHNWTGEDWIELLFKSYHLVKKLKMADTKL